MPDTIAGHMLASISKPIAFFNDDGMMLKSNKAWDMLCRTQNNKYEILFYSDFLDLLGLKPMHDNESQVSDDSIFNHLQIRILRRRIFTKAECGIMVEIDDISNSTKSREMSERISTDTIWKMRSRISSIQNVFSLLIDYNDTNIDNETMYLLSRCRREAWELERQMENLRYLSQIDTGCTRLSAAKEDLNINALLDQVILKCDALINAFDTKPQISVYVDKELTVYSDRSILTHALISLLSNALIYNDHGGPIIFNTLQEENMLRLSITDSGWGIAQSDQPSIFTYKFRGNRAATSSYSGLGIELYLAQKLLNLANCSLEFISREKRGSVFSILFGNR